MCQLEELKLGELLDTPPPGLDEAIAISKACTTAATLSSVCYMALDIFGKLPLYIL